MDNAIALGVKPLQIDVATPLLQAAKFRQSQVETQQAENQMKQNAAGQFARGIAVYADTPEFGAKWAEGMDQLHASGMIDPQSYQRLRNSPSPLMLRQIIAQTQSPDLAFREGEAKRAQGNTDRAFTEQQRQFNVEQTTKNLEPGFVRTPEGGQAFVPGGPKDPAYIAKATESKDKTTEAITEREKAVVSRGGDPKDPQNRSYILTGKMPREDQQPLTATDKKAILEADEMVLSNQQVIDNLNKAKELSPKAYEGPYAAQRGYATGLFKNEGGEATVELNNLVTSNALAQLKSIFGAAPTEGERKILLDIQGSASLTDKERQKIFDRAIQLAERRMEFNKQRAAELRGGTFYKTPEQKATGSRAGTQKSAGGQPENDRPEISDARIAIGKGAPRAAVEERLRKLSIPFKPSDLDLQ